MNWILDYGLEIFWIDPNASQFSQQFIFSLNYLSLTELNGKWFFFIKENSGYIQKKLADSCLNYKTEKLNYSESPV